MTPREGVTKEISFTRTVRPLLVAPAASVVVQFLFMAMVQRLPPLMLPLVILVAWTWAFSLAAAALFVLPVLRWCREFDGRPCG